MAFLLYYWSGLDFESKGRRMKSPKVSVFLSYYNDAKFLKSAIDAILAQDFTDFELILLNHATTDNSREIARSYDDPRIVHIDKDFNYGAGCGLLIRDMLDVARGKYIKLCCADDILHRDCLSKLVEYLDNNPDCGFVCSKMDFIDEYGRAISNKNYKFFEVMDEKSEYFLKRLYNGQNDICYPTVMIRKDILNKIPIDSSFIMLLDVSLWSEFLCSGHSMAKIDKRLVSYRIHSKQASNIFNSCSFVEKVAFANLFYKISDLNFVKFLCDDVDFAKSLTQKDKKFFPFVLAIHNLQGQDVSFAISGYSYIHQLMNDDDLRAQIEQRFGFGIADFRKLYVKMPSLNNYLNVEYKKLNFIKLSKLLARRVLRVLAPKFWLGKISFDKKDKKHIKIIRLKGGLGNQLYQWAFGVALGLETGDDVLYDISWFDRIKKNKSITHRNFELKYFIDDINFADKKIIKKIQKKTKIPKFLRNFFGVSRYKNVVYDENDTGLYKPELLHIQGDKYYDGYFSSEKYFEKHRDVLLKNFSLKTPMDKKNTDMLDKILNTNSVSMHIRRGDFIKFNYPLCSVEYYKLAMNQISKKVKNPHFFIFSDDIQYVRDNFEINDNITIVDINDTEHGYYDFELMRKCKHNITANSTFSIWASILNENKNRCVITPYDKKGALK